MDRTDACILCCEVYGKNLRPRVLHCGHSYCTDCLQKLIRNGILSCPECQRNYPVTDATEFSINYCLENLIAKSSCTEIPCKAETPIFCDRKNIKKKFFEEQKSNAQELLCRGKEMKAQLDRYDRYLEDNIKRNQDAAEKMREMAIRHDKVAEDMEREKEKVAGMQNEAGACIQKLDESVADIVKSHALAKVTDNCEEMASWLDKCQEALPSAEIITSLKGVKSSLDALEAIDVSKKEMESPSSSFAKEDLSLMEKVILSQENHIPEIDLSKHNVEFFKRFEKRLVAVNTEDGHHRSAKISVKDSKVYLHYLQERAMKQPSLFTIGHRELISSFVDPESVVAFLDLSWEGLWKGRLHILLSSNTPLARQFRVLCTGDLGPSYASTKIFEVRHRDEPYECICGGDYQNNDGSGGAAVIGGIAGWDQEYRRPDRRGAIGTLSFSNGHNGQFFINTGCGRDVICKGIFGQVQEGYVVLAGAAKRLKDGYNDVEVVDCGVALDL